MSQTRKAYEQSVRAHYSEYFGSNVTTSVITNADGTIAEYDLAKTDRSGALLEIDKFSALGYLTEVDSFMSGKLNYVVTLNNQNLITEIDRYASDGKTIFEKDVFDYSSSYLRPNKETITDGSGSLIQTDIFTYGTNGALNSIIKYGPSGNLIETDIYNSRGNLIGITHGAVTTTGNTNTNIASIWSANSGYGEIDVLKALNIALSKPVADVIIPSSIKNEPALSALHFQDAWAAGYTGKGVVIADIDTGIDLANKDTTSNLSNFNWNFITNNANVQDDNGHGTFTASEMIAANNGIGLTGAAYGAQLMVLKALDAKGQGTVANIVNAINWAVDHGANVINMSLGWTGTDTSLEAALNNAKNHGIIVAVAAGNSAGPSPEVPASYAQSLSNVIAVGASSLLSASSFSQTSFSNRAGSASPYNFVDAPGQSVLGYGLNSTIQNWSGTSMAAPLVAAEAADLLSANTTLTTDQIVGDIVHGTVNLSSTSTKAALVGNSTTIKTQSLDTVHALSMNSQQPASRIGLMGDEVSQSLGQLLANSGWDAVMPTPGVISLNSTVIPKNGSTVISIGLQDVLTYGTPEINLGVAHQLVINGNAGDIQLAGSGWSHLGHDISANSMYEVYVNHNNHLLTDSRLHVFWS